MMEDRKFKKEIINELDKAIEQIAKKLKDSNSNINEQVVKVDVLLDTMKFLDNYDENVEVLTKYWLEKKWQTKFSRLPKEMGERDD